ncbi:MAG: stage II sporulation protein R, partial [Hominilimicola sp.]
MNKFIAAFALALCMTVIITSYSDSVQADLQDNLIRLHIIADSDDDDDQAVKIKVRDAVLNEVGNRLSS